MTATGSCIALLATWHEESGDVEISRLFKVASDLHINYYENWWSSAEVGASLQDVQRLLDKLDPLIEERILELGCMRTNGNFQGED